MKSASQKRRENEVRGSLSDEELGLMDEGGHPSRDSALDVDAMDDDDRWKSQRLLGLGCVLSAACIWVISSYWVKSLEGAGVPAFVITSFSNSMFVLLLPLRWLKNVVKRQLRSRKRAAYENSADEDVPIVRGLKSEEASWWQPHVFAISSRFWPLWFVALFTYNVSFLYTNVITNTILSIGGTGVFTLALESHFVEAKLRWTKLAGTLLCILGTALYTVGNYQATDDRNGQHDTVTGAVLCLGSALLYSSISVLMQKQFRKEDSVDVFLFWGYLGAVNISVTLPMTLVAAGVGWLDLGGISSSLYGQLVIKGCLDNLLTDFLWTHAMIILGSTVANVGMSIQTPMVLCVDIFTKNAQYFAKGSASALMATGAVAILLGFYGVNMK